MSQNKIVYEYEIAERNLLLKLCFIALVIVGIGLFALLSTFFILFQ